jgi:hypothetical protein
MRERCAEVYGSRAAAVARALADASPAEIATFVRLMGRIASEFEALAAHQPAAPAPTAASTLTPVVDAAALAHTILGNAAPVAATEPPHP